MNNCKIFTILLSFFYISTFSTVQAVEFKTVDLDRLLKQHPLLSQYDSVTGRFRNTPSEIFSVAELEAQMTEIASSIALIEENKRMLVANTMLETFDRNNEDKSWDTIGKLDRELDKAKAILREKQILYNIGGDPGINKLYEVVSGIYQDVKNENFTASEAVYLNRLPVHVVKAAGFPSTRNYLSEFFYNPDKESLLPYLAHVYNIGMLFNITTYPVVYQKGDE